MRLIDADAAKQKILEEATKVASELNITTFAIAAGLINMFDCEDDFPTIKAEPVRHGEWKSIGERSAICSLCSSALKSNGIDKTGKALIFKAVYKYCPYCGARMDGGNKNG